jgi:hypothetical protein
MLEENMSYIDDKLEKLKDEYYEKVAGIASSLYDVVVIPICKKYHLNFSSGMGTWSFYSKSLQINIVSDVTNFGFEEHLKKEKIKIPMPQVLSDLKTAIGLLRSSAIDGSDIGTYIGRSYKYEKPKDEHIDYLDKKIK